MFCEKARIGPAGRGYGTERDLIVDGSERGFDDPVAIGPLAGQDGSEVLEECLHGGTVSDGVVEEEVDGAPVVRDGVAEQRLTGRCPRRPVEQPVIHVVTPHIALDADKSTVLDHRSERWPAREHDTDRIVQRRCRTVTSLHPHRYAVVGPVLLSAQHSPHFTVHFVAPRSEHICRCGLLTSPPTCPERG
ncbi:hypothetical protein [Curtobacterium poinsettiae]|uniref:hypothetical protein n=1 Tax=Curtobacterium poinsettiae TaxID=159612 RepID=UPI0023614AB0|nr:hypothetical protein [Curtobacterium flaccumfaciens]MDD1385993.1 hypothetical protein [Curtobacterium flaccumfaciens pv. poinsettiae]